MERTAARGTKALVLASASPRRRELLTRAGVEFDILPAEVPEERRADEAPEAFARRLAEEKALAVARRLGASPRRWVLGADTVVVSGTRVLGKPAGPEDAVAILSQLVGRRHRVITGIALAESGASGVHSAVVESTVEMRRAGEAEIRAYVAAGESLDKAGAYALQGEGRRFVVRVDGSESNVIGLPVEETLDLLRRHSDLPLPGRAA
jgi:septum formation protein